MKTVITGAIFCLFSHLAFNTAHAETVNESVYDSCLDCSQQELIEKAESYGKEGRFVFVTSTRGDATAVLVASGIAESQKGPRGFLTPLSKEEQQDVDSIVKFAAKVREHLESIGGEKKTIKAEDLIDSLQ